MKKFLNLPCAFHTTETVSHFCHCEDCMLPLCAQCIPIHRKEHISMDMPPVIGDVFQLMDKIFKEIDVQKEELNRQASLLNHISKNIYDSQRNLTSQIEREKEDVLKTITEQYDAVICSVQEFSNTQLRGVENTRTQIQQMQGSLTSIQDTFFKGKAMRSVIMWQVQGMFQQGTEMLKKLETDLLASLSLGLNLGFAKIDNRREILNSIFSKRLKYINDEAAHLFESKVLPNSSIIQSLRGILSNSTPDSNQGSEKQSSSADEQEAEQSNTVLKSLSKLRNQGINLVELNGRLEQRKNMTQVDFRANDYNTKSGLNTLRQDSENSAAFKINKQKTQICRTTLLNQR